MEDVSGEGDKHVADRVNHLFNNRMLEHDYKEITENDITRGSTNCYVLGPVESNVLNFRSLKDVNEKV